MTCGSSTERTTSPRCARSNTAGPAGLFFAGLLQPLNGSGRVDRVFTLSTITTETTLSGAATAFLAHLEAVAGLGRISPTTVRGRRYGLQFLKEIGSVRLRELTRPQIIEWSENLATTVGVARRVPAGLEFAAIRALQSLLRWCADRGACSMGLASRIPTGYRAQPGQPLSSLGLDLMRAALAANDHPHRMRTTQIIVQLLRILAQDGARTVEVRLARAANFDQRNGVLRWPRGKNKLPRVVVLSDLSINLIRQRMERTPAGESLFANPYSGEPVCHFAVGRTLTRIAMDAGIENASTFSPHDFRHTFATLALEAGVSVEDVAAGLGHTTTQTVKDTYLHNIVPPGARRANAAVNGRAA